MRSVRRLRRSLPPLAALVAALACGAGSGGDAGTAPSPVELEAGLAAAHLEAATLREALAEERAERLALELEVERLHEEIEQLTWAEPGEAAGEPAREEGLAADESGASERPWFDAEGLVEHGIEPAELDRLREAFDASELALLELENRAQREGWIRDPRYRQELRDMRLALRAELGDDRFDRLLYASGRNNRIVVSDLLQGSAAEDGGIQPGDEILSYAERRVFRPAELKQATLEGRAGERVAIEVLRDGSRVRIWVPRGPIGIRMRQARRPPPW